MKVTDIPAYTPITGSAISRDGRFAAVVTPVLDAAAGRRVERAWLLDLDGRGAWKPVGPPAASVHGVTFLTDGRLAVIHELDSVRTVGVVAPTEPEVVVAAVGAPPGAHALKTWGGGLGCLGLDSDGTRRVWGWRDVGAAPEALTPAKQSVADWAAIGVSGALTWIVAPPRQVGAPWPSHTLYRSGDPPVALVLPENPLGYLAVSDGGQIAVLARPRDEPLTQPRLWVVGAAGAARWLAEETGWITGYDWDGETLVVAVDDGVDGKIVSAAGPGPAAPWGDGGGYDTGPRIGGRRALFLRQDGHMPQHLRLREGTEERRLTRFHPAMEAGDLRPARRVTWTAPDGLGLEGLLYTPSGEAPYRTVVWLHGGPAEHLQRTFSAPFQVLLAAGFAVFAPNPRGSTGRGDAFLQSLRGGLCTADVADVEAGVRRLIVEGVAHRRRIGVMGWSYGGSLALAVAAACPWVRAVVAGAPVADWLTVFGARTWPALTAAWFPGPPWEHPAAYDAASPARRLGQVNAPTLLLHGELDDRVPPSQSRLVYQVLSARGVVTDLRLFPGEGHLFHAPWAVQEAWARALAWLQHHTADGA